MSVDVTVGNGESVDVQEKWVLPLKLQQAEDVLFVHW